MIGIDVTIINVQSVWAWEQVCPPARPLDTVTVMSDVHLVGRLYDDSDPTSNMTPCHETALHAVVKNFQPLRPLGSQSPLLIRHCGATVHDLLSVETTHGILEETQLSVTETETRFPQIGND